MLSTFPPGVRHRPPHRAGFQGNSSVMSSYKVDKSYCCRSPTQALLSDTHTSIHPSGVSVPDKQDKNTGIPFFQLWWLYLHGGGRDTTTKYVARSYLTFRPHAVKHLWCNTLNIISEFLFMSGRLDRWHFSTLTCINRNNSQGISITHNSILWISLPTHSWLKWSE